MLYAQKGDLSLLFVYLRRIFGRRVFASHDMQLADFSPLGLFIVGTFCRMNFFDRVFTEFIFRPLKFAPGGQNSLTHPDSLTTKRTGSYTLSAQREMMFLILVNSSYLNSNNIKVMHSSTYANIRCIHQLLLKKYTALLSHISEHHI